MEIEDHETIASRESAARLIQCGATPRRLAAIGRSKERVYKFAREYGLEAGDLEWLARRWDIDFPKMNHHWD